MQMSDYRPDCPHCAVCSMNFLSSLVVERKELTSVLTKGGENDMIQQGASKSAKQEFFTSFQKYACLIRAS